MSESKIHISRAIWDEDTHEVAYIVDGLMFADVATQRKLNAVDDMYEALEDIINQAKKTKMPIPADLADSIHILGERALRMARGERRMIKNCDNCRNCFVESDDSLICAVNCKPLPPSKTCNDWEGCLIEELLREARGEME